MKQNPIPCGVPLGSQKHPQEHALYRLREPVTAGWEPGPLPVGSLACCETLNKVLPSLAFRFLV